MKTNRKMFWSAAARRRFGSERSSFLSVRGALRTKSGSAANESCAGPQHSKERRAGTTLTEVLISMLIMSFGLATVATLFPVSAIRSAQAVKLTNSTILRYNAEARIDMEPALIHNPDFNTGATSVSEHLNQKYIVDPLGWNMMPTTTVVGTLKFQDFFGNDGNGNAYNPAAPLTPLRRYHGGRSLLATAQSFVMLPDSWNAILEDSAASTVTTTSGVTGVVLSSNSDLSDIAVTFEDANENGTLDSGEDLNGNTVLDTPDTTRVLLFDADNRFSQIRTIKSVNNGTKTVNWKTAEPLPSHMSSIGQVRIETQDRRYTWLLTVRKGVNLSEAAVDVVVFFNRDLTDADETVYQAAFAQYSDKATIVYNSSIEVPFKKGAWVLDVNNAEWYRVQEIIPGATSGSNASVTIALDRPAQKASPAGGAGRAMFPRGIVDVYPIGQKPYVAP